MYVLLKSVAGGVDGSLRFSIAAHETVPAAFSVLSFWAFLRFQIVLSYIC
jgi:hypothetical protein